MRSSLHKAMSRLLEIGIYACCYGFLPSKKEIIQIAFILYFIKSVSFRKRVFVIIFRSALTRSQYTLDPAAAFVTSPLLLRFNTSRSTLSPDVDINGQPIYSELITVLISPASRLPFTFTMSYATTDAASLALLLVFYLVDRCYYVLCFSDVLIQCSVFYCTTKQFESLSSSLVVVSQLPASRLVAVSFPVGSSSVGILVSSIAPLPATVTLTLIRLP